MTETDINYLYYKNEQTFGIDDFIAKTKNNQGVYDINFTFLNKIFYFYSKLDITLLTYRDARLYNMGVANKKDWST